MKNNDFSLENSFGHWIQRLAGQLHWAFEARLAPSGVSAAQFVVMLSIHRGAKQPSEVAAELGIHPAAVTRLLDRLADKGLFERCSAHSDDRRSVGLALSPQGKKLMPGLIKELQAMEKNLLKGIPKEKQGELIGLIRDLEKKGRTL